MAMGSFLQGIEDADQKVSEVGNKSFGVTSGSLFNPLGIEESYIYEKRSTKASITFTICHILFKPQII